MNLNLNINLHYEELIAIIITKTLVFYKISPTDEELKALKDSLFKDEKFKNAINNIIEIPMN